MDVVPLIFIVVFSLVAVAGVVDQVEALYRWWRYRR